MPDHLPQARPARRLPDQAAASPAGETTAPAATPKDMAAGCPALRDDDQLMRAAALHAQDMVAQGYFSHTSLDGRTFGDRITAQGYARPVGENFAAGQQSAQASWVRGRRPRGTG